MTGRGLVRVRTRRAFVAAVAMAGVLGVAASCRESGDTGAAQQEGARVDAPADVRAAPAPPARYAVGHTPTAQEVIAWDIDVGPDGRDLPAGSGTHARGATVYAQKCAACHGARGEGMGQGPAGFPAIIGREPREGFPFGQDYRHVKTVGNYWPYATTLFDYVRRAMPLTAPGSLTNDETYSLVAYLLAENDIVARSAVMNAAALRQVKMPARDRFVRDDRKGGAELR